MISVVIAAYNEEKTLEFCLDGLVAQTVPGESYEIIVADDGSTDKTKQVAESRGVRVVTQSNQGPSAARNLGAQQARGDVVLFIDADSIPDSRCVETMAAAFADPELAGASGEKKTRQTNLWARLIQIEYDFKYARLATHPTIDFVDSSTAGYRREIFLSNGGFDTKLKEAEDVEFSFRLAERGYRMILLPEAITYHTHPESLMHYLTRKFQYARGRAIVYTIYPAKAASDTRTPQAQKLQMIIAPALLALALLAVFWNVLGWVVVLITLIFIATTLSFVKYSWQRDEQVALVTPLTYWLAAISSGLGAVVGFLQGTVNRKL
jgi:cellulose synthase/poly-beta-1,6-N-acetylglucosamine synthase-like glycosyltransferase